MCQVLKSCKTPEVSRRIRRRRLPCGLSANGLPGTASKAWQDLEDRSSRPRRLRQPMLLEVIEKIERLRRQRLTGKQIAAEPASRWRCQLGFCVDWA